MSPEASALANVLLNHHRQAIRQSREPLKDVNGALISYGILCDRAGLSYRSRNAGPFLRELAEWCHDHGWSPINSLAVNHATRMPGEGYDKAPGCSRLNWPKEVEACIESTGYPDTVD